MPATGPEAADPAERDPTANAACSTAGGRSGCWPGSTKARHGRSIWRRPGGLLHQADEQWAEIDKAADEELKQIVFVRGNDIKQSEARDQIHRRQLQARLARAWVQYEMGQTYPAGSVERTAALQDAGKRFDTLYDQQRERLAGFYARLGRGLCWKDLGESEKAFAIFEELLGLPDDPADFHALRGKAAVQALETSLLPEVKKYKQGLDIAQRWLGGDHPQPASGEVDLAIRFLGGEAALAYAEDPAGRIARAKRIADPADRLGAAAIQHRGRRGRAVSGEGQNPPARSGLRPCRRRANRGPLPTPAIVPRRPWTVSSPPRPSSKRPRAPARATIPTRNANASSRLPPRKAKP